jgi:threonine aldolase
MAETMRAGAVYDLRSDTVTKPTPAMRQAMANAEVGDDMSGEDPTVNRLETMCATLFGKEAAVFGCSGTQSNQMAVRVHCQPGDEILCQESSHVANYEAGAPAALSGVTCRTLPGEGGMLDLPQLRGKVRGDDQHLVRTRVVWLENTTNVGGGRAYPLDQMQRVGEWARDLDLKVHLDGARLFNAVVAKGYSPQDVGRCADTISVCFSKGLGCPMGSILVGSAEDIRKARRARKLFGGALRQAGIVAAAAIYAIEHNIDRLAKDHENAKRLAELIAGIPGLQVAVKPVETNLVFFDIDPNLGTGSQLSAALASRGVRISAMDAYRLRACTHMDVPADAIAEVAKALKDCLSQGLKDVAAPAMGRFVRG